MSRNIYILFVMAIFFGAVFWGLAQKDIETAVTPYVKHIIKQTAVVSIGDGKATVEAEIADTPRSRAKGLMGRPALLPDKGMLFVFDTADKYEFTMAGMLFRIDIVWIRDNKVVDVTQGAELPTAEKTPTYKPREAANEVLEVPFQYTSVRNIRVGDNVKVDLSNTL